MAKKRKASNNASSEHVDAAFESRGPKLHLSTYEDVADSEDEFLMQRDKILLDEGPDAKRRRKLSEEEALLEPSDEEVLALPESDVSDDDVSMSDSEGEGEAGIVNLRASKTDGDDAKKDKDEDEEYEGWGNTRDAYYGADNIDTEQAALEEETEAKRLQQKQLQTMNEADFGFDDNTWQHQVTEIVDGVEEMGQDIIKEVLPELHVSDDMGPEERLKLLRQRYPEFEPIVKEFVELHGLVEQLAAQAKKASILIQRRKKLQSSGDANQQWWHGAIIKYQALAAYMGIVAMYFAILTSTADSSGTALAKPPLELRDHPIMDSLLKSRQLWVQVKTMPIPDMDKDPAALNLHATQAQETTDVKPKATTSSPIHTTELRLSPVKPKKPGKSQLPFDSAAATQHTAAMQALETDLATLTALIATAPTQKSTAQRTKIRSSPRTGEDSDLGDEPALTAREAAAKAARKKTLGFYTSRIAQKAKRRGEGNGDVDIPYRERLKERQDRLARKGEGKAGNGSVVLVDGEGKDISGRVGGEEDEDGYYEFVSAVVKKRREDRKAVGEAYDAEQRVGGRMMEEEEGVGVDGKRKISYQMQKNKGLTPFRRKEVRNPRVKKRMKFEEKKKKLASVRAVFKPGKRKGGYGGELTGIKTGLVKSVKF